MDSRTPTTNLQPPHTELYNDSTSITIYHITTSIRSWEYICHSLQRRRVGGVADDFWYFRYWSYKCSIGLWSLIANCQPTTASLLPAIHWPSILSTSKGSLYNSVFLPKPAHKPALKLGLESGSEGKRHMAVSPSNRVSNTANSVTIILVLRMWREIDQRVNFVGTRWELAHCLTAALVCWQVSLDWIEWIYLHAALTGLLCSYLLRVNHGNIVSR